MIAIEWGSFYVAQHCDSVSEVQLRILLIPDFFSTLYQQWSSVRRFSAAPQFC